MNRSIRGSAYLIAAALIWGLAFSAQSVAGESMGPFAFTAARSLVSFAVLSLFMLVRRQAPIEKDEKQKYIKVGVPLGVIMFFATVLQQIGLGHTTVAKSGFITALYIIIVPVLGMFFKLKVSPMTWVSVALSLIGLGLLCLKEDMSVGFGDLITLGCAAVFSLHIIAVDRYASKLSAVRLCAIQFGVGGLLSLIVALFMETTHFSDVLACWPSLLYVGVCSGALGYTFQFMGQRDTEPTLASLILCLESVFAALGGWILLNETLVPKEICGCVLMLAACMIAQIPSKAANKGMAQ